MKYPRLPKNTNTGEDVTQTGVFHMTTKKQIIYI